jgi:hypothetical protein
MSIIIQAPTSSFLSFIVYNGREGEKRGVISFTSIGLEEGIFNREKNSSIIHTIEYQ